ncbi:MAG: PAS domain-containing protein [Anaerolineales bacterium]|nr:MAG: PAS domain-containing protein [Anaerolineales bacterium]
MPFTPQTVIPFATTLAYSALTIYILVKKRLYENMDRLLALYLLLAIIWGSGQVLIYSGIPESVPAFHWDQIVIYGLVVLSVAFWAFARSFLQKEDWMPVGWLVGLAVLILMAVLDWGLISLPFDVHAWTGGWFASVGVPFLLSAAAWACFSAQAALITWYEYHCNKSPLHRNRIKYLVASIVLVVAGYGFHLTQVESYQYLGLGTHWLGAVIAIYAVVSEHLPDISAHIRQALNYLVIALFTIAVYLLSIYVAQAVFAPVLGLSILIGAAAAAVFFTVIYHPLRGMIQRVVDRVLFRKLYDSQKVVREYSQAISNVLYLDDLTAIALGHISETLDVRKGALLLAEEEDERHIHLRMLPGIGVQRGDEYLSLAKNTPITGHLVERGQPLTQYAIDVTSQFKSVAVEERQQLEELGFELFVPIRRKGNLVGLIALGPQKSGRPYSGRDLDLLRTLADQTVVALENARLFDRVQRNLEEITRMKNLMDNVFASIASGVITTDVLGRITLYNRAAESILGVPAEQCLGRPYYDVLRPLNGTALPTLVEKVKVKEERCRGFEVQPKLPGRGKVSLSMNLSPLKDAEDRTQGVAIVVDDVTETRRLQAIQDMFRRYLSPAVVDRLPSDPAQLKLGGHRQEVSILFADLRGFTSFSEKLPPEEMMDTLNRYLSMAAEAILAYEGTLDKFMGDAVMAIFNAPLPQEDHALRTVKAAVAMQRAIADYHRQLGEKRGLSFGVGINVGEVVVGNIGTTARMDYTAIGDAVNLAKRLEENVGGGRILLSQSTYERVKDHVNVKALPPLKVKGRMEPEPVYELISLI